jgi:hypothetical protein
MANTNHQIHRQPPAGSHTDRRLVNPFTEWSHEQVQDHARGFISRSGLNRYETEFLKGASLAQSNLLLDGNNHGSLTLTSSERKALLWETSNNRLDRFRQPRKLYLLVAVCSLGAAVQGWYGATCKLLRLKLTRPGIKQPLMVRRSTSKST